VRGKLEAGYYIKQTGQLESWSRKLEIC